MSMQQDVTVAHEQPLAIRSLRDDLERMEPQFKYALPAHIPVARFVRIIMTAVQNNPRLLKCTRQSFFNACMKAAQDGLLPDGREGAIIPYSEDEDGRGKADTASWQPMIRGIRKLVRNSGALADWNVQVVQEGDEFDYRLGDDPFIHHKPSPTGGRERKVLFAYSIATYPDGTKSREVMNADQIADIRKKSKAKKGPWSDLIFFPEMARKTVAKLHSKQLPMSTDLDRVLHRDDELYDFAGARERGQQEQERHRPPSVAAALDAFGAGAEPDSLEQQQPASSPAAAQPPSHDDTAAAGSGGVQDGSTASTDPGAADPPAIADGSDEATAYRRGQEARAAGHARKAVPGEYRDAAHTRLAHSWLSGWDVEPKAK